MIDISDLLILFLLAHVSGAVVSPLYVDIYDGFREWRNARAIRRQRALPVARAVPSYWIDTLAHLNKPTVTRRRRREVIDV